MRAVLPAPPASSPAVRSVMQGNRARDTAPERALRGELHRRGLRFRKHVPVLSGLLYRPDVIFRGARVVVECRGCFWHMCPIDGIVPRSHTEYWRSKLMRNVERDYRNAKALASEGWELVVVWEHENPVAAADRIEALLKRRSQASRS